jgi:hypothetical protein
MAFVAGLRKKPDMPDWQIAQAEKAVRLFFRFFRYLDSTTGSPGPDIVITRDDLVNFLAWLANRQQVAASTQNPDLLT